MYMFLRVLLENVAGKLPVIRLGEEAVVYDLKRKLEKIIGAPWSQLDIQFLGRLLRDHDLISKVFEECQERGLPASGQALHKTDLIVLQEDKLKCWLGFVDGSECGEPGESMLVDSNPTESSRSNIDSKGFTTTTFSCSPSSCSTSNGDRACGPSMDSECIAQSSRNIGNISALSNRSQDDSSCHSEKCCLDGSRDRPEYADVMPENRQYAVVMEADPCSFDQQCILKYVSERIGESRDADSLLFSTCVPLVPLENALLIVSADAHTREWIERFTKPICPPYRCVTFIHHFDLVRWCFTIPAPNERTYCRIFKVLEKQNVPLDTSQWSVISQATLDPCGEDYAQKTVSPDYSNMEVVVYIDKRSADQISDCSKLDYLFWELPFTQCEGIC